MTEQEQALKMQAPQVEERTEIIEGEMKRAVGEFQMWAVHLDKLLRRYGVTKEEKRRLTEAANNVRNRLKVTREV